MSLDFEKIINHFNGNIAIFCHHNADPDAICSAYALKSLIIGKNNKNTIDIILPNESNKLGKKIIEVFDIEVISKPRLEYSNIFIVDTGSLNQLKPYDDWIILLPLLRGGEKSKMGCFRFWRDG